MRKNRYISGMAVLIAAVLLLSSLSAFAAEESVPTEEDPVQELMQLPEEEPEEVPAEDRAAEEMPAEEASAQEDTAAEEMPAEEASAQEDTAAEEMPAEETAAEEAPAQDTAPDEAPAEEANIEEELLQDAVTPSITYQTHVQTYGWQDFMADGVMAGTSGESKRLEGIRIRIEGMEPEELGVEYCTHVQTYGWQNYVADGAMAGTNGESKRLEAIRIRLTGTEASKYDVYYCVHVQTFGWLGWAKNGEMAGTAGYARRLEGIRIQLVEKDAAAPAAPGYLTVPALYASIEYQTHVQTYGWQGYVADGALSGTSGQSKRLEGIRIRLGESCLPGSVKYRTHVQTYGWEPGFVCDNAMSGTSGQSKRLEAIEIALEGDIAGCFDIWYRTHVQRYGWTGWAKNGESCGSEGCSYRLEGIEIRLLPKGSAAPGATDNTLYTRPAYMNEMISRAQSFYSATDWLILTNVTTHIVGIFHWNGTSWELYKEILSSTGAPWSPTVEGEFIVQAKIPYFGTSYYRCWYATQFWGDYLFHSVLYNVESGPYTVQDGRLGMAISHGCVRMELSNAKWIYDNIPSGTKVYIYH